MENSLLWLLANPAKLLEYMLAVFALTEATKGLVDSLAKKLFKVTVPTRGLAWFWSLIVLVVWEVVGVPFTAKLLFDLFLGSAILGLATFSSWDFLAARFAKYFEDLWAGDVKPAASLEPGTTPTAPTA